MTDVIVYYRSRPSEPEASDIAMRLQREAFRAEADTGRIRVVGEYVERKDDISGVGTRPSYIAAIRAARACEACLVIASHAAIGSGEVFAEPAIEDGRSPFHVMLSAALVLTASDIPVPAGALGPVCLYAEFRPGQLDTLIYLCNAGTEPLLAVMLGLDGISMFEFYTMESDERWADPSTAPQQHWDTLPAGRAVLIDHLSHVMWDMVHRYRLSWSDEAGRRWMAEADSLHFGGERLRQDPSRVWEVLRGTFPPDQPDSERG